MSPATFLHATPRATRRGIERKGLLRSPGQPIFGVYVFDETGEWDHTTHGSSFGATRCRWTCGPLLDVYRVDYIGPMTPDPYVENGIALLAAVAPENVTLVTRNDSCRNLPTTGNLLRLNSLPAA